MKKIICVFISICGCFVSVLAQNKQIPLDPQIRYGQLENGLTYYIRHNEQPKKCAEFHIAQNVGAVLEENDQNGLAHFLEHMAFNGTKHFPSKGIISYFESIGVAFGKDINAYTSIDETVYRLSNVPTIREGIIDSALLVLYDWSCAISLFDDEIDAERGVIREEWRTGATANRRMWKQSNALKYPNTQYAKRDIIGDTAVINNFEYDALRRYYKKWYGPDLQAIVVVGDINVDSIEAKIKNLWKDVPARENRGERPLYGYGENKSPIVAIVTDDEAPFTCMQLEYKHPTISKDYMWTEQGYKTLLIRNLIISAANNRFDEISMKSSSSFAAAVVDYSEKDSKLDDEFVLIAISKNGKEKDCLHELVVETERLKQLGITADELKRAKSELMSSYETMYKDKDNNKNLSLTQEYIRNFTKDEIVPGIEKEYELAKQLLPNITLNDINSTLKQLITDDNKNLIVAISASTKSELPTESGIQQELKSVKEMQFKATKEEKLPKKLVSKAPKLGKIKEEKIDTSINGIDVTRWWMGNAAYIYFIPTKLKNDEILFFARSGGGLSHMKERDDLLSASAMIDIVGQSGVGDYSATQLSKMLAGKNVSLSFDIDDDSESISGYSSVNDLETLLQLNYLYFTSKPRKDEDAYKSLIDSYKTVLANRDENPKNSFNDSIVETLYNHNERVVLFNQDFVENINHDKALQIFHERFSGPQDYRFYFVGNINPNDKKTREIICKWIGAIEDDWRHESYTKFFGAKNIVRDTVKNYFTHPMKTRTASNYIAYSGNVAYSVQNKVMLSILEDVLFTRYLESIREREGGSYGVHVNTSLLRHPDTTALIVIQYDTDPKKQEKLQSIIHEEIQKIITEGPLEKDIQKAKEILLKSYEDGLGKNNFLLSLLVSKREYNLDYSQYKDIVDAITTSCIQQFLKSIVEQGNLVEVVMMPE